jgi:uncharacterized membrane protein
MKSKDIRQKAREILKDLPGKYQLFLIPIILSVFSMSLTMRESIIPINSVMSFDFGVTFFPLFIQLLLAFFLTSACFTMLEVVRHKQREVSFSNVNLVFSTEIFGKLVMTVLVRWLYLILWSLIWIVGTIITVIGTLALVNNLTLNTDTTSAAIVTGVGLIIFLIGIGILIVKQYSYSMAEYILYDKLTANNYNGPREILAESNRLMKGYKWKLFVLEFSFFGWYILTAFTFGLLYFYVLPYSSTAHVIFYNQRLAHLEEKE